MAKNQARNYSQLTLKKLYALSGNNCAFPGCPVVFLNWENDTNYSNICHIEDANPDTHKADRYNPNMSDKQRAHYKNLILLCPNHHIETNDPKVYNVKSLKDMKREHESKILQLLSGQNLIAKNPSLLNMVVNKLGNNLFTTEELIDPENAPDPENKIEYNNVVRYKPVMEEYKVYHGKLNKIYEEIEKQGSTKKEFVLRNINSIYLKEKGKFNSFEEIKQNADNIIENVENELWELVVNNEGVEKLPIEAIKISILIVLVDAFMRCDILEEPPK
ncbi:HNH endonuclease [bacterium]|nr:MAG: HNH endonuclease [bacterium]